MKIPAVWCAYLKVELAAAKVDFESMLTLAHNNSLQAHVLISGVSSAGVNVSALLSKIGLNVSGTSERVGAVALAYAAHKALSPVRFPPTVILTPLVAKMLGKEAKSEVGTGGK